MPRASGRVEKRHRIINTSPNSLIPNVITEQLCKLGYTDIEFSGRVSGGSIHSACKILCDGRAYFLKFSKLSDANLPKNVNIPLGASGRNIFEVEKRGLELLRKACIAQKADLVVPNVFHSDVAVAEPGSDKKLPGSDAISSEVNAPNFVKHQNSSNSYAWILMEYLPEGSTGGDFFERFGIALANLHNFNGDRFGLDHDNFIGSLHQSNKEHEKWTEFFIHERLAPQTKKAVDAGLLSTSVIPKMEILYGKLESLLPDEPPALIHGDLWSGNFMSSGNERMPAIFDPAVYFGHREVDLAFSHMFGGFSSDFYHSYEEEFPLVPGFNRRINIYNLYPLLVHVNLFGGGYVTQFERSLSQYL